MFERYTEKARRVIFFARSEAGRYGSPFIETEHLLLGLLRENRCLVKWFPGEANVVDEIRTEIDKRTTRREAYGTSIETPLSLECKQVLDLAADSCERLGHRRIESEHLLLGILRIETSLAAQILTSRGVAFEQVQDEIAKTRAPVSRSLSDAAATASMTLESFLSGLRSLNLKDLAIFFSRNAEFIDASGKRWDRDAIEKGFEALFAPYAKKNASYTIEAAIVKTNDSFVATVVWKNVLLASEQRAWMHRMCFVLSLQGGGWEIALVQVTPVQPSAAAQ